LLRMYREYKSFTSRSRGGKIDGQGIASGGGGRNKTRGASPVLLGKLGGRKTGRKRRVVL